MPDQDLPIAIAGAGIAGLTAALALARHGIRSQIHERVPVLLEVGAGIQLSPNASRILMSLGLGEGLAQIGHEPNATRLHDAASGRCLTAIPFKPLMQARYGAPYLVVHRADLQNLLLKAVERAPEVDIQSGQAVAGFTQDTDRVRLDLEANDDTRSTMAGRALLIADGIHSRLREQISPGPGYVGHQTAWRGSMSLARAVSLGMPTDETSVLMGPGFHAVFYRMGQRSTYNVVLIADDSAQADGKLFAKFALRPWRVALSAIVDWKQWPIRTVRTGRWYAGRAALIGDAAHAMSPHAAQGGAMAIEDSVAIAACLADNPDPVAAFAEYERKRRPRVERVVETAEANRRIYQMSGPMALARNLALFAAPPTMPLQRLDWLYRA